MNVLEKILEEIKGLFDENTKHIEDSRGVHHFVIHSSTAKHIADKIMCSHMDEHNGDNAEMVGWIPVSERVPEEGELVIVTVHVSEWISNYEDDWVREEEKKYFPSEKIKAVGWLCKNGRWKYLDEYNSEISCEKKFGSDKGHIYDVVTAWMPLPEPYKPEER